MRDEPEKMARIVFSGSVDLPERSIWPDKNAPENWTAKDVVEVLRHCGRQEVLREWNIDSEIEFEVTVDGEVFGPVWP